LYQPLNGSLNAYGGSLPVSLIEEAAEKFHIRTKKLFVISTSLNTLFTFTKGLKQYFLRFTHQSYQDFGHICAEVDWIEYLKKNLFNVPAVKRSSHGKMVERVFCENGYFTVVCFERVRGYPLHPYDWKNNLFKKLGALTGKLHAASKLYVPLVNYRRKEFFRPERVQRLINLLSTDTENEKVIENFALAHKKYAAHEKNSTSYGLIHNDLSRGNYFIHGNNLSLIDFEYSGYNFFAGDLAFLLYDALNNYSAYKLHHRDAYLNCFFMDLFDAYQKENFLPESELELVPVLMTLYAASSLAFKYKIKSRESFNVADCQFAANARNHIVEGFEYVSHAINAEVSKNF